VLNWLDHVSGAWRVRRTVQRHLRNRGLRRLDDVLGGTPLAGRYWVHGGALLGWARDGKLLLNDLNDVDLAYRAEDRDLFEAAIPSLVAAGFRVTCVYRTLEGRTTMERFRHGRVNYEFFAMWPEHGRLHTYSFGYANGIDEPFVELIHEYPDDGLEPFTLAGRTWLKPAHHEAYLEANYGDWRVSNPDFVYLHSPSVVERRPCPTPETVEQRIPS
jgi:hypothetical protein